MIRFARFIYRVALLLEAVKKCWREEDAKPAQPDINEDLAIFNVMLMHQPGIRQIWFQ